MLSESSDAKVNELTEQTQQLSLKVSLHVVVWESNDNVASVRQLLEAKADANQVDATGHVPLHLASIRGYSHIAALLLEYDAYAPQTVRRFDVLLLADLHSSLTYAAMHGHPHVIELLVKHRGTYPLNVNAVVGAKTALHWAAERLRVEAVKMLLELRADPSHQGGSGCGLTPYLWMMGTQRPPMANGLPAGGAARQQEAREQEARRDRFQAIGRLLRPDCNTVHEPGLWLSPPSESPVPETPLSLEQGLADPAAEKTLSRRRLLEAHAAQKRAKQAAKDLKRNFTLRDGVETLTPGFSAMCAMPAADGVRPLESWAIQGSDSLPTGLTADLLVGDAHNDGRTALAALYKRSGLYRNSKHTLAAGLGASDLTIRMHNASRELVAAASARVAKLVRRGTPVLYLNLFAVDEACRALTLADDQEPPAKWLISELRHQLERMLPPGRTSYILLQSVGYQHKRKKEKDAVVCVSVDDGLFKEGLNLWRKHSDELTDGTRFLALQLGDLMGWCDACCFRAICATRPEFAAPADVAAPAGVAMGKAVDAPPAAAPPAAAMEVDESQHTALERAKHAYEAARDAARAA
eukprot:7378063-Prymnesium_polylepis.1